MQNHSTTRNQNARKNRISQEPSQRNVQRYAGQVYDGTRETVSEYPVTSVLITMGLGFGAGMLLASMIAPPPRRRTYFENASGRMEDLGHRVMDAVSSYLPRSSSW
jgi:hypothetical protein